MALTAAACRQMVNKIASGSLLDLRKVLTAFIDGDFNAIASVTATATELNKLGSVTGGTVAASKAVVTDANKDLASFRNVTLTGTLTTDLLTRGAATPAAAGSNQGNATAITKQLNAVTAADATKGVILPTAVAGQPVLIVNTVAASVLKVYPASGGTINGLSQDAAFSVAGGALGIFIPTSTTQWRVAPHA
jgi:hypothetical protein